MEYNEKEQVKELLNLTVSELDELSTRSSINGIEFIDRTIYKHFEGYNIDEVIIKIEDKYYKFLVITYLDDCVTYTIPYRVIKKTINVEVTKYTTWIEVK